MNCFPVNAATETELYTSRRKYTPKKIYYQHDNRNNEDVKEEHIESSRDRKKKLLLIEGKWGHDKFCLQDQYPKSKHELIETYGYDIRSEDGPPHARGRRYGRGPTKYVRNWEDVTAYGREKFRGSPRGNFSDRRASGGRFRGALRFRKFICDDSRKSYLNENAVDHEEHSLKEDKEIDLKANVPVVINNSEFPALTSKDPVVESEVFEKCPYFQRSLSEVPKSKSVLKKSNLSRRNSLERQHDRHAHQFEKGVNMYDRNFKQLERSNSFHDKSINNSQHDRGTRNPMSRGGRGSGKGDYSCRGRRGGMCHIFPRSFENKVNSLSNDMEQLNIDEVSEVCKDGNIEKIREIDGYQPYLYASMNTDVATSSTESQSGTSLLQLNPSGFYPYHDGYQPYLYASMNTDVATSSTESQSGTSLLQLNPSGFYPYHDGYQPYLYASMNTDVATSSTESQSGTSLLQLNPSGFYPYHDGYQPYLYASMNTDVATSSTESGASLLQLNPSGFYPYHYGLQLFPRAIFPQPTIPAGQSVLPPSPCFLPPPSTNLMDFPQLSQYIYQNYAQPPPFTAPNDIYQPGITYFGGTNSVNSHYCSKKGQQSPLYLHLIVKVKKDGKKSSILVTIALNIFQMMQLMVKCLH